MAISLQIRKKSTKNFQHFYEVTNLFYGASDIIVRNIDNRVYFSTISGAFVFTIEGFDVSEISVYDDSQGTGEELYANVDDLLQRLINIGYNAFYEDGEVLEEDYTTFTGNVIPLNNKFTTYNTDSAQAFTAYTLSTDKKLGSTAKILINTTTEPTITGATKTGGQDWETGQDFDLFLEVEKGTGVSLRVIYFFAKR